jgi:hypothetical protein
MTTYDARYFYDKFSKIPEDLWYTNAFTDPNNPSRHCALGHCGMRELHTTHESDVLNTLFSNAGLVVAAVNDGGGMSGYNTQAHISKLGDTPKERILTVLQAMIDWSELVEGE